MGSAHLVPTRSARQLSRSAPAKISLALAVCSFTRMVSGRLVSGSPTALTALSSLSAPLCVTTIGALSAAQHAGLSKLDASCNRAGARRMLLHRLYALLC